MSARCRSNERLRAWGSPMNEQIIVYKRFRLHPKGDWDLCIHIGIDSKWLFVLCQIWPPLCWNTVQHWPKSVQLRQPQKRCRHVFPGCFFHDICFIFPGFPLFYLFWDYHIYIYVISRILERIALLDFTEPWIILNFPLILSSEFRIDLLCTSHWECILTGWRLTQNRSMIHVCIYI